MSAFIPEIFSRKKVQKSQQGETIKNSGSVLVVVLVVCLGLVSLALVLGHSMLMAYRGADNEIAGRQAEAATLGAVQYAETILGGVANPGDVPDPTTYQSANVPVGDGAFWFIGAPVEGSTAGSTNTSNSGDQPIFGLVDEASKLNLNRASYYMVRLLPGMTDDLAQAIVAWRTTSATASSSSSTGESVSTGTVKQGFMESVDELGLVIGGTDNTLLYGDDLNLNHVLDPEETSTAGAGSGGQLTAGLYEYCTVYSREPNIMSDGTAKTPMNNGGGDNMQAVMAQVSSVLGASRSTTVRMNIRNSLRDDTDLLPAREPAGSTASPTWVGSVLEFYARSGLSAGDFAKLQPYLANSTGGPYTSGLINVNTASQAVLACVPGIGDARAAAIVAARAQRGSSGDQSDMSWIVTVLGAHYSRAAGPWLTTRSYQVSADVAAVGRFGRGYRRTRFVIDLSKGTPMVVYRRDLAYLGWALGRDERANSIGNTLAPTQGGVSQ